MESKKKEQILASAIKIFGEKCFQNATIVEIAKDAGVGDATIAGKTGSVLICLEEMTPRVQGPLYEKN